MTRARTYYELLNVSRSASQEQIRSAYLRLMKNHHPDVASDGAEAVDLPFINQVYAALSEPGKRAAYDAQLARQARSGRSAATAPQSVSRPPRAWGIWFALAFAAVVAAFAVLSPAGTTPQSIQLSPNDLGWLQPQGLTGSDIRDARLPAFGDIRRQARLGATAAPNHAVRQSANCFSAARARASLFDAQLCVVFDDAFLYSRSTPYAGLPPYFSKVVVKNRHASALAEFVPDEPLAELLWKVTFAAMMANLEHSAKALDEAPVPDPTSRNKQSAIVADGARSAAQSPGPSWDKP